MFIYVLNTDFLRIFKQKTLKIKYKSFKKKKNRFMVL